MRVALDTNILAYAEGINDSARCIHARKIIERLSEIETMIPAQVLGELFRVLARKAGREVGAARQAVLSWADSFLVVDSTWDSFVMAFDLVETQSMSFWDALIFSVAVKNRCRILLSEDMKTGLTWCGTTIVNPFAAPEDPLLKLAMENGSL